MVVQVIDDRIIDNSRVGPADRAAAAFGFSVPSADFS
jgi:hypothetical protein